MLYGQQMMDSDEFENGGQEAAPIDMLAAYFEANGWSFDQVGEDEIVLQLLALPDIRVTEDKRAAVYETLGLINEQLWLGHFELWSSSGIVLFRHGALLGAGGVLTLDQAQILVETAIDECERFYPVFQFVLWGGKSPTEAISASLIETRGEA
jgi:hypothetical protein